MSRKGDTNNRANQMNPNNEAYWTSRGYDERPPDWEECPASTRFAEHISGADFRITANIAPVLEEFGAGVYTVQLWADNETVIRALIAEYSIFYDAD